MLVVSYRAHCSVQTHPSWLSAGKDKVKDRDRDRGQGRGQTGAPAPTVPSEKPSGDQADKKQTKTQASAQAKNQGATEALLRNARLTESMRELLPGQDVEAAASGFRNVGQFVSAAHVSKNLGIPFSDLKTRMVDREMNLGDAIKDVRPGLDGPAEARKAEEAARKRVSEAERQR